MVAQYQELPAEPDATAPADFSWAVRVVGDEIVLSGDVPYLSVKELLNERAGDGAIDRMGIAEGAPLGFMIDAAKAVEASALLSEGSVTYGNSAWAVTGVLRLDADRAALDAMLGELTAAGDPWLIDLTATAEEGAADGAQAAEADGAASAQDGADVIAAEVSNEELVVEAPADAEIPQPAASAATSDAIVPEVVEDTAPALVEEADDAANGADELAVQAGEETAAPQAEEADQEQEATDPVLAAEPEATPTIEAESTPAAEPDPDYTFSAEITESGLVFSGQVPDAATRLMAGNMASGLDGVAELTVAGGAPDDFTETAFAGIAALEHLETGRVSLSDGEWRIEGEAAIDTDGQAAVETLDRLSDADIWDVAITAPSAADICREQVESYMTDRAILFGSGSARLTGDSEADLAGLAEIFAICPSAPVYVEGHTDADGGAEDNLILSLSRAEAVVDALVDLGIDPGRLYAVGYGASLPIASNETAAGKAQNRRIVFSFEDLAGT